MRTWLSRRFGLDVPVVCAPMAGAAAGELAAAGCRGGGLGMIGVGGAATPEWISEQCKIAGSAGPALRAGPPGWPAAPPPRPPRGGRAGPPAPALRRRGPPPAHPAA